MKNYPGQKTLLINFTPNISDEKIKEIKDSNKNLKIIRTISKMTDPADDGLRMPIPPASLKIKKPKKKKKWSYIYHLSLYYELYYFYSINYSSGAD